MYLARRRRENFGVCASILSGKRLDLARRRREIFGVCASILSGKPLDLARRRRENFGIWSLYTMGNTLVLPAAGAKILGFRARMQGEMHWFCPPPARFFCSRALFIKVNPENSGFFRSPPPTKILKITLSHTLFFISDYSMVVSKIIPKTALSD